MWRIIIPFFLEFIGEGKRKQIEEITNSDVKNLIDHLNGVEFRDSMATFIDSQKNVNFRFWCSYLQMVQILLLFVRAQREGNWGLHLSSFTAMLPLFMRYDHLHYSRWGTIYVNEMHQLPSEVLEEFLSGNFVERKSTTKFNQADPDQSQEWLSG